MRLLLAQPEFPARRRQLRACPAKSFRGRAALAVSTARRLLDRYGFRHTEVARSEHSYRTYTNRLRRMSERQQLVLHSSKRRDPRAHDFGIWTLTDLEE
jgi:hypothetical protein